MWCAVECELLEGFESFAEHCPVLQPVVAAPSFPEGVGANAVVRYRRIGVRDSTVWPGRSFTPVPKSCCAAMAVRLTF